MTRKELFAAAIDIGGTKIDIGIVNSLGKIITTQRISTISSKNPSPTSVSNLIFKEIKNQSENLNLSLNSIGFGVAGQVDANSSKLINAPNLRFLEKFDFKTKFNRLFKVPVIVENDARCFSYCVATIGEGKPHSQVLGITIGTGIGGGLVSNGVIQKGAHQNLGEIGHTLFIANGLPCTCGAKGCFEQYCSGSALIKTGRNALNMQNLTGNELFLLAKTKNKVAINVFNEFAINLGLGLASAANLLDPSIIVLGGSVTDSFPAFSKLMRISYSSQSLPAIRKIPIVATKLSHPAMRGAGLLSLRSLNLPDIT